MGLLDGGAFRAVPCVHSGATHFVGWVGMGAPPCALSLFPPGSRCLGGMVWSFSSAPPKHPHHEPRDARTSLCTGLLQSLNLNPPTPLPGGLELVRYAAAGRGWGTVARTRPLTLGLPRLACTPKMFPPRIPQLGEGRPQLGAVPAGRGDRRPHRLPHGPLRRGSGRMCGGGGSRRTRVVGNKKQLTRRSRDLTTWIHREVPPIYLPSFPQKSWWRFGRGGGRVWDTRDFVLSLVEPCEEIRMVVLGEGGCRPEGPGPCGC